VEEGRDEHPTTRALRQFPPSSAFAALIMTEFGGRGAAGPRTNADVEASLDELWEWRTMRNRGSDSSIFSISKLGLLP
jgi:hypothetical protein